MATFEQFRFTFPEDSNEKGEVFLAEWMFKNHPSVSINRSPQVLFLDTSKT